MNLRAEKVPEILPETLDKIIENDISSLVTNQVGERKRLEYKEQLPERTDKAKKEFLADVCSLANAEGGDIVFGIRDLRDANGHPTGIAESVMGVAVPNSAAACERLEQMIRDGIAPRIPTTETVVVGDERWQEGHRSTNPQELEQTLTW